MEHVPTEVIASQDPIVPPSISSSNSAQQNVTPVQMQVKPPPLEISASAPYSTVPPVQDSNHPVQEMKTPVTSDPTVLPITDTNPPQISQVTPKLETNMSETQTPTPSKAKLSPKTKNSKTYLTMIHETIVELGDRTGSSVPAIMKVMNQKYPLLVNKPTFKNAFNQAIKNGLKEKRLVKVRASYKVSSEWVRKDKAKSRAKALKKKMDEKRRKSQLDKKKEEKVKEQKQASPKKENVSPNSTGPAVVDIQKAKLEKEEAEKKRAQAAAKAKEIADRIKKRRFPMDDQALIAEDKQLRVKRPAHVIRQPFLPYALMSIVPNEDRPNGKKTTPAATVNACTEVLTNQSRSLVSNILQIYSFFSGDVGFSRIYPTLTPNFTLSQLLHAVNEVAIGNSKLSRVIPPLISQLFFTALKILTDPSEFSIQEDEIDPKVKKLYSDLSKLNFSLDETSWSECLFCYIDLMNRYYTSEASSTGNELPGFPITIIDDENDENSMSEDGGVGMTDETADGYTGYLGPQNGNMRNAYLKLMNQDPWYLNADEILSLLRALTDDILGMHDDLAQEFVNRDDELIELLKAKRSTEYNYRKARVAYEGPKKKKKSNDSSNSKGDEEDKKSKPSITKVELEAAESARGQAIASYEQGLKNLITRTEPIGFDRNHNAVYYFHHNPQSLFIEKNGIQGGEAVKSWHIIDNATLFDDFVSSLDVRGTREYKLHFKMIGNGGDVDIKRLLSNSKKQSLIASRQREEERLNRKLDNAMIACAAEEASASGRRSTRLKTAAKDDLYAVEKEIRIAAAVFEEELEKVEEEENDFHALTGIKLLREFESKSKVESQCNRLWMQEDEKSESGIVSLIVSNILKLEGLCEELSPYKDQNSRDAWKESFQELGLKWNDSCVYDLGPPNSKNVNKSPLRKKQRKSYDSNGSNIILSALKGTLVELEDRIYTITGKAKAVREVDLASENVSVVSEGSQTEESEEEKATKRKEVAMALWMDKINSLGKVATKRAALIRDVLISAIGIARKAQLNEVVEDLQSALKLHRPGAGGQAKSQALSLIDKYGGYDSINLKDSPILNGDIDLEASQPQEELPSCLCVAAMVLTGCLEGHDDADRVDWKESVMECKKISRVAALSTALVTLATPKLEKLARDRNNLLKAIEYWDANQTARKSRSKKKKKEKFDSATEVWANTEITTETFIMAKVEGYPWWPARVCEIRDPFVAESLERLDKKLISFIGEEHLHVVDAHDEIKPFSGEIEVEDDLSCYSADVVGKLKKSIKLTTSFMRGAGNSSTERFVSEFLEEKKTST